MWELTDFFNYLMVLPNVVALFALTKTVTKELKENGIKTGKPLYEERANASEPSAQTPNEKE